MAIISSRKKSFSTSFVGEKDKRLSKVQMERKINKKKKAKHTILQKEEWEIFIAWCKKSLDLKKVFRYLMGIFS